jgi:hypothetical protein
MKFGVERDAFADAVAFVARSLPSRAPVPVSVPSSAALRLVVKQPAPKPSGRVVSDPAVRRRSGEPRTGPFRVLGW